MARSTQELNLAGAGVCWEVMKETEGREGGVEGYHDADQLFSGP